MRSAAISRIRSPLFGSRPVVSISKTVNGGKMSTGGECTRRMSHIIVPFKFPGCGARRSFRNLISFQCNKVLKELFTKDTVCCEEVMVVLQCIERLRQRVGSMRNV